MTVQNLSYQKAKQDKKHVQRSENIEDKMQQA